MNVLVAGATGALGVPLVRRLVANGHQVTGLTRSPAKRSMLQALGARPAVGDVLDGPALKEAFAEAAPDAVVHALTALPKNGPTRPAHLKKTNELRITGTANLLEAALVAGARRFVAESIVLVYGATGNDVATEQHPVIREAPVRSFQPALDAIRSLEEQVNHATATGQLEGILLRYGLFYGPEAGSTDFLIRMLRRGFPVLPGGGRGVASWIHLQDAASATVAAIERGHPGEAYNIVDDQPVSLRDFATALAQATGGKPPRSIPLWILRLAIPMLVPAATSSLRVSNEKAKRDLGWVPVFATYREGTLGLREGAR